MVYVPEYRNIGESPSADSASFDEVASDISALIEKKCLESGYDKLNILAHSYGGTVMMYVLQNSESAGRVHQIVFEDFAPCRRFQDRCSMIFGEQFLKEFDLFSKIDLDRPKNKVTDEVCREDTDNTSKFRYCRCSSPMYGRQCSTVHSSRRISTEDARG